LTAGERERGTLETLMVAPVPTVDLIAGKFVVVTLIGLLSASLNLLSVGGTVYFGGLGEILTKGGNVVFPLYAMPWVLVVLVPLAVMFSAVLLAVCSFARSFKEAQNYIMPVMIAALIPAVVGSLPGTRLEGPMLVVPVANVVVLTRDLFVGRIEIYNILWVTVSSTIYAVAAVAAAAKLFGQEAVLFADSGSIKSLFVRRFFKKRSVATASQALLLLSVVYLLHFILSQTLLNPLGFDSGTSYLLLFSVVLLVLLAGIPLALCGYTRVRVSSAFGLGMPRMSGVVAGLCLGLSTWILAPVWFHFQQQWLTVPPEMLAGYAELEKLFASAPVWLMIVAMAIVPGILEELFFRGYVLRGLRGGLGVAPAIIISALAFAMFHHSIHRLVITAVLGLMFGLLVVRSGSIWPAIIAHMLHNGLSVAATAVDSLRQLLIRLGWPEDPEALPPQGYVIGAAVVTLLGLVVCFMTPAPPPPRRATGDFPETPLAEIEV
ncbi:MAG: CPBP family intramembrane metalloprotease, partial [Phycisphaerae bacterium]|nr:CPBP family intramembrane metalloprotease [Phycisphaerae bacterium]